MDKMYRFHWFDGKINEGAGSNVADAFTRLGFGRGALPALDYYEEVESEAKQTGEQKHE